MNIAAVLEKIRDPYDRKARVAPGLWVIFPLLVAAACLLGPKHPVLTTLGSLLAACGGPYLLGSVVRAWGLAAEKRLYAKWDGKPSTIILRHRDKTLGLYTKRDYHESITRKLGIPMPSATAESADHELADEAYRSATEQIIKLTRDTKKFSLLFKELIAYGFNRNMFGARWVGSMVCIITIGIVLLHARVWQLTPLQFMVSLSVGEQLTIAVSLIFLALWLFHFTESTVKGVAYAYALRLMESLPKITVPVRRATPAASASETDSLP
jgi:hypothetical protein